MRSLFWRIFASFWLVFAVLVGLTLLLGKALNQDTWVLNHHPAIDGLAERWGRSVLHCPYCHGYELQEGRIGVVGCSDDGGAGQALLLCDWGNVTLFCSDAARIDPAQKARLDATFWFRPKPARARPSPLVSRLRPKCWMAMTSCCLQTNPLP